MKILYIEPFYGGSHKQWIDGYIRHSRHDIRILSLSAHHWKWRMHGAAVTLAGQYRSLDFTPDLIIASDFLDLSQFVGLLRDRLADIPTVLYFHENQMTYPWSPNDVDLQTGRDNHYSYINYSSALAADRVLFNSAYHRNQFINALPGFLNQFPDHRNLSSTRDIEQKSTVLHLGLDLAALNKLKPMVLEKPKWPVILWNHRWEYDKNPNEFFSILYQLKDRGVKFHLIVLGERSGQIPEVFNAARTILAEQILHWGYCEKQEDYAHWLWMADILPVTAIQDFFGISVVEAVYCNTIPLLPERLAYSEHFTKMYQRRQFFYKNTADLTNKLQRYCFDVRILRRQQTQYAVCRYDWSEMVKIYDDVWKDV